MPDIQTLDSKEIYKNKWMRLREDSILRETGETGVFSVVEKNDFVVVIPMNDDCIYIVEQYRYPISERTVELPQGSWESKPGTDPIQVARGELKEETGLSAEKMTYVGYQCLACGYSNQGYHIYLATGLSQGGTDLDDEEVGLTCRKIGISTFEAWLFEGKIKDATTTAAYLLAKFKGFV